MNTSRRKRLCKVIQDVEKSTTELRTIQEEEDDARDNIPENLQGRSSYEESEEISDAIDSAIDDLVSAVSLLENVI